MPISVVMPALEMAQETGKLISWLKQEGQRVTKGEPLLEIETDKAVMEVEAPADGVLAGIKVQAGSEVPVGQTIAWILHPGETVSTDEPSLETARKTTSVLAAAEPPYAKPPSTRQELRISPKARRLAAEQGVDLSRVRGSGPAGEILASDVHGAAQSQISSQSSSLARLMAERTTQSWTTVPHFYVTRDVDAESLSERYQKLKPEIEKSHGVKLTYTDLLVALLARVLTKNARINASWIGRTIHFNSDVNMCIAMADKDGVVAPVVHHANRLGLGEVAVRRRELTDRVRAGKLQRSDIQGGTFTISNLGMFDVDAFSAIIVPPQAAILAVGRIAGRAVALDGHPAVRAMMTLTLSSDHRVVDGVHAAEFLRDVSEALCNPRAHL